MFADGFTVPLPKGTKVKFASHEGVIVGLDTDRNFYIIDMKTGPYGGRRTKARRDHVSPIK